MLIENFQTKYTTIPIATFSRAYKRNTQPFDFGTLPHMHKEMELLLVLDGEAALQIGTITYTIQKGNIVVLAPYTLHRYTIFADRDFKHYCLCFDLDMLYDKQLKIALESGSIGISGIIENQPSCAAYIENIFIANQEKKAGWEMAVIGNIHLLFSAFKEYEYMQTNTQTSTRSVYHKIFDYIAQHHGEDITSSDVAAYLGFNNSYFCRLFRKTFGDSFQNYLCKYRIENSKRSLRHTDTPISQIATDTGFNSCSYYSKKFKEYTHTTPSAYREKR